MSAFIYTFPTRPGRAETRVTGVAAGTLVATMTGEVAAERLQAGMTIITRDAGLQQLVSVTHTAAVAGAKAVRIAAGALGNGLPERDITVSEGHRVLLCSDTLALLFDVSEALVAAGDLVGRPGITRVTAPSLGWVSLALASGELVLTEGVWSESEPKRMAGGVAAPSGLRVLTRLEAQLAG